MYNLKAAAFIVLITQKQMRVQKKQALIHIAAKQAVAAVLKGFNPFSKMREETEQTKYNTQDDQVTSRPYTHILEQA